MNTRLSFLILSLILLPNFALANSEYLVARAGAMFIQANNTSPLLASGLYYGYALEENIAFEAEANIGLKGGNYNNGNGSSGDYDVWTVAAYTSYRYPFTNYLYAKGKFGLLFENIINNTRTEKLVKQDYGFSGGIGIGLHLQRKFTLETEFCLLEKDIYHAGLGMHYRF